DDERTAQHERADRDPGRLAHRRKAQVDADIAALDERPECFLVRVAEGLHLLADAKVRALEERVEVKVWRGRPDEEETGGRKLLQETPKRLEQLRDTFGRRQVADAGDDGRAPVHLRRRLLPVWPGPRRMRDLPDRAAKAVRPNTQFDE